MATVKAQKALRGEAGKPETFVQEIFEINFRLTTADLYCNQTDSTGVRSLCDPGVILVNSVHCRGTCVSWPFPAAARPFTKLQKCHFTP